MNPSTAFATVFADELARCGVREVVLAPGSRSTPMAMAFHALDVAGRLRLHVRIDERSVAFTALGLAKAGSTGPGVAGPGGRAPVAIVCTSGTAAANFHPAIIEASESGVPLLVLTADRPPELRGTGANQTSDQVGLSGGAVRWAADVGVPEAGRAAEQNRYWRSLVSRALIEAGGTRSLDPGPVHLNRALREPLLPDAEPPAEPDGPWAGRPGSEPWTEPARPPALAWGLAEGPSRTLVVIGSGRPSRARDTADSAAANGWPVIAEPSSGTIGLRGGALLLGVREWLDDNLPDRVVVAGRPTLSRPVSALLADPRVQVESRVAGPRWPDPTRSSGRIGLGARGSDAAGPDREWAAAWCAAAERVGSAVDAVLDGSPSLTAARLARDVVAALPSGALLVLGSSTPVRDVDRLAVPRADLRVLANRGVAGIDGTISTAIGAASAHGGPAFALMGDLTFLHDLTGLLTGDGEPMPDLTVVVPDNDGGGIFAQLEPGEDRYRQDYRRVFGTPHGRDLVAVARALGWAASTVETAAELGGALGLGGPRVIVVRTDQRAEAALARDLRAAAAAALG